MKKADVYMDNRKCLLLIPEVVDNFRKQMFFKGTQGLSELLNKMNTVINYIFEEAECIDLREEAQQTLEAVLEAQTNQDYILQADIIEEDLKPLLQQLQLKLQKIGAVQESDFFEDNMLLLKQKDEKTYMMIKGYMTQPNRLLPERYHMGVAINGQPTVLVNNNSHSFWMHSTVNPQREAQIWAESLPEKPRYQILGLGLGYHVLEILKQYPESKVVVFESEVYLAAKTLTVIDWTPYLEEERLNIMIDKNISGLLEEMVKLRNDYELLMYYPSIQSIEDEQVRNTIEEFFVIAGSVREQKGLLDNNFQKLEKLQLPECSYLKGVFCKKNVVIVGAGPSVNETIQDLKKYRGEIVIFATGHIARTLIEEQIYPDAIIITDPQEHLYQQIEGLQTEKIPLILLSTAASSVIGYYKGPIYVAYQKGYEEAEQRAKELGVEVFKTGGSVTTTALDIALQFEAARIIFVGADMAYTGGNSHADGVGRKITDTNGLRKVISCNGGEVYTSKSLDIYRKWIERRIENVSGVKIYNTGNGADIKGACWGTLSEILNK